MLTSARAACTVSDNPVHTAESHSAGAPGRLVTLGRRLLHDLHDVGDRDERRVPAQPVATVAAAPALDQAAVAQLPQHVVEELHRQLLGLGERLARQHRVGLRGHRDDQPQRRSRPAPTPAARRRRPPPLDVVTGTTVRPAEG